HGVGRASNSAAVPFVLTGPSRMVEKQRRRTCSLLDEPDAVHQGAHVFGAVLFTTDKAPRHRVKYDEGDRFLDDLGELLEKRLDFFLLVQPHGFRNEIHALNTLNSVRLLPGAKPHLYARLAFRRHINHSSRGGWTAMPRDAIRD